MAYKIALPTKLKDLSNNNLKIAVRLARSLATTCITSIRLSRFAEQCLSERDDASSDIEEARRHVKVCRSQLVAFCAQLEELEAEAKHRKLRIEKWQTTKLEIDDALGRIPARVN